MTKYKIALIASMIGLQAFAQNETDMLMYSQQQYIGSARALGVGGAFGAVGADYSSSYLNPAGLGLYRRNEFHFSAAITTNNASSNFLGTTTTDNRTGFNIPSFGLVFTKVNSGIKGDATKGVVSYSFAFGHNRLNDYQRNSLSQGYNTQSKISDFYTEHANGIIPNQLTSGSYESSFGNLGYQTYLIDPVDTIAGIYEPAWFDGVNDYRLFQTQTIRRRGAFNEYNFAGSMNISNILYLGAGLVINSVNHQYTSEFTESDPDKTVNSLNNGNAYTSSYLNTYINTSGNGIAGRFGAIVRPIDVLKLGVSVQTRSRIKMEEYYHYEAGSNINVPNYGVLTFETPKEYMKYTVITPARYTFSAALTLPSLGFLSADLDVTDYSKSKLVADKYLYTSANNEAQRIFQTVYTMRVGAEIKLDENYRLRAGYNYSTSPYAASAGFNESENTRQSYSLGWGYTDGHFFIDAAGVMTKFNETSAPYVLINGYTPSALINNTMFNFVATAGYRF
jgi:long-subunit fatty acid transport protein